MINIIFAVCDDWPDLSPSDAMLAASLEARGAKVAPAPWTGPQAPFAEADLVVARATWDYAEKPEVFARWLERLERGAAAVVNPPPLMRWNMDKRYLLELAEKGAPLPPTRPVEADAASIAAAMEELGIKRAVVKPQIGAGARGLSLVDANESESFACAAETLAQYGDGLVQSFLPEIGTFGETSMVFIDGGFAHAVVKRPKSGDIRVQEEHGGRTEQIEPPAFAVDEAARLFDLLPDPAVYARIDGVILDQTFQLMEVELIEPELFLTYAPELASVAERSPADRFADALMKRLYNN